MPLTDCHVRLTPSTAFQSPVKPTIAEFAPVVVKPSDGAPEVMFALFDAPIPLLPENRRALKPNRTPPALAIDRVNVCDPAMATVHRPTAQNALTAIDCWEVYVRLPPDGVNALFS